MSNIQKISWLEPKSILDLGSWIGHWAMEAHRVWPHASIHCVEGNPACEEALKLTGFPYQIAMLGEYHTSKTYYKQEGTDIGTGNGLYRENSQWFERCASEEVDIVPLESLFPPDAKFDLIKLDLQGAEIDAMMGGRDIIKRAKALLIETSVSNYNQGAPMQPQVIGFCRAMGFPIYQVIEDIHHPANPSLLIQQDLLFTHA
jgi:FkbM family methyltransferase